MSQFAGYVLPGSIFIAFGLKWSLEASGDPYAITTTIASYSERSSYRKEGEKRHGRRCCSCCGLKYTPMEGFVKLFITVIGIATSLVAAYPQGQFQHVGDILYATMYLFFGLSGLVDVLTFYCPYSMPYGLDKFSLALAFFMEGLMFQLQLSHEAFMEQHIHILLISAIFACAFICLVEIVLPYSLLVKFARALFTLVHGSWYIQSGFLLYSPTSSTAVTWSSSEDFNNALVWISLMFAWHCAGGLVLLLIMLCLARKGRPPKIPPQVEAFEEDPTSPVHLRSATALTGSPSCHFCSNPSLKA